MTETTSEDYLSQLKNAIIDLYLDVKIRSTEEVLLFFKRTPVRALTTCLQIDAYSEGKFEGERERLVDVDSFIVIDYIKSSIEILMNLKMEEQEGEKKGTRRLDKTLSNYSEFEPPKEYETVIQKLENDIRNHIRVPPHALKPPKQIE